MQKWKTIVMGLAAACVMVGCGAKEKTPVMDMISIQQDGIIKHTIVEQLDSNYYDMDNIEGDIEKLAAMAKEKAVRYSINAGDIVCDSVEEKNGQIIVTMTYQNGQAYTDYNRRELFSGAVWEALAQEYYLGDVIFQDGESLSSEEIDNIRGNHIVIVRTKNGEELDVNVYDKILYASENVSLSGKKDAVIATGANEDMISYIIFQ